MAVRRCHPASPWLLSRFGGKTQDPRFQPSPPSPQLSRTTHNTTHCASTSTTGSSPSRPSSCHTYQAPTIPATGEMQFSTPSGNAITRSGDEFSILPRGHLADKAPPPPPCQRCIYIRIYTYIYTYIYIYIYIYICIYLYLRASPPAAGPSAQQVYC